MTKRYLLQAPVILILALMAQSACAGSGGSCDISVIGVNFGTYNSTNPNDTTGTGSITVTCAAAHNPQPNIQLSVGSGGESFTTRHLLSNVDGSATLNYNLYCNDTTWCVSPHSVWGDGSSISSGTTAILDPHGNNIPYTVAIYGVIPALQNPPVMGTYSSTISVNVIF